MKKKNLILGVAGTIVAGVIALSACSDTVQQTGSSDSVKQGASAKHEAKKEVKPEDKIYKVGDTVTINGLEVAITKASFTPPAQYGEPEKGKVLTLEIHGVNKSDSQQNIYDGDFNVYDSKGNHYDEYFSYDKAPISADLNKGKQVTGKVSYDVAKDTKYEVVYTTFLGTEIKFDIEPK
jgi:hypothetical protein